MKNGLLDRLFALAAQDSPAPPAADLEERVLAQWRMGAGHAGVASDAAVMLRTVRVALLGACAVLVVTCAVAYPILRSPSDPGVVLTNFAMQYGLSHE